MNKSSFSFFLPVYLISFLVFAILYFTKIYEILGVVSGYGWENSTLLDIWFKNSYLNNLNIFVDRKFYIFIFPAYYFFISVPIQEYIFRVLPFKILTRYKSILKLSPPFFKYYYYFLISAIFAALHLYYMQPFAVSLVFLMGVLNAIDYSRNQNFFAICSFHFFTATIAFTLNLA